MPGKRTFEDLRTFCSRGPLNLSPLEIKSRKLGRLKSEDVTLSDTWMTFLGPARLDPDRFSLSSARIFPDFSGRKDALARRGSELRARFDGVLPAPSDHGLERLGEDEQDKPGDPGDLGDRDEELAHSHSLESAARQARDQVAERGPHEPCPHQLADQASRRELRNAAKTDRGEAELSDRVEEV